jgi:hypothetical protein
MMITNALVALGYNEFVVRGDTYDGIEWMVVPETIPSEEQVLVKVEELKELEASKPVRKAAILERLGLTEDELRVVLS